MLNLDSVSHISLSLCAWDSHLFTFPVRSPKLYRWLRQGTTKMRSPEQWEVAKRPSPLVADYFVRRAGVSSDMYPTGAYLLDMK